MNVSGNALREFHLFAYIKHKLSNRLQSTPKYKYTRIVCLEFWLASQSMHFNHIVCWAQKKYGDNGLEI